MNEYSLSENDLGDVAAETVVDMVSKVMDVGDIVLGKGKELFRIRGKLLVESDDAYDRLSVGMSEIGLTPLFRLDKEDDLVIILRSLPVEKTGNPWLNIVLFVATLVTVLYAGSMHSRESVELLRGAELTGRNIDGWLMLRILWTGWPFALSLLGILGAHEMGHYIAARKHGASVTLPYFIPFPSGFLGTMGAVIQMKGAIRNKRVLLDVALSGPLAGLAVAIPVVVIGLHLSEVGPVPVSGFQLEGNSIMYLAAKYLVFGELLPMPVDYGQIPPVIHWVVFFFTGNPSPGGGTDVFIHPVALAGWAGMLVTGLNLIPVGQLDGGHILYVLFGKSAKSWRPLVIALLVGLGFVWSGWWIWAVLLYLFGQSHPEVLDEITELDDYRRSLAFGALILFFLLIVPVPLSVY
ncbi:MAG TPA: site-2 protease family protein [Chloroflexi bacterium]|nr:site-2 protease family protein [Chloroflexota bacterium]|tara:strand:- start:881 stop:2104 length:1224 start_codon:yes stop_codon:yes gene_type:complete